MSDLLVRLATAVDRSTLAALRRAWTEENAGGAIDDDTFETRFDAWFEREHDQRLTWLGTVEGEPVGMLNLLVFTRMPFPMSPGNSRPMTWGYLANFFVLADHRNAGSGPVVRGAVARSPLSAGSDP